MLLESLKNNDIKSEMLNLLSDDNVSEQLESYEKKLIMEALKKSGWKVVDAAKFLRIPRTSLQYKMEKYGIKRR